eukprot:jgi/Hompol1/6354/HPOL_002104-RA
MAPSKTFGRLVQVGRFTVRDNGRPIATRAIPVASMQNETLFLVAATMVHNKASLVAEWIEFHLLQGFDRIVIYNHMSTDNTRSVVDPYIKAGVVEWVTWPTDMSAVDANQMTGPRIWPNPDRELEFNRVFTEECLEIRDTWHIHGGCQRSALMDFIARYRYRAEWITTFDVDEFFFVPEQGTETSDVSSITTVRDILEREGDAYDHIRVSGEIFGTSGYLFNPLAPQPLRMSPSVYAQDHSLITPFSQTRLQTEAFRFRAHFEISSRHEEFYLKGRSYCEKSFARARLVTGTKNIKALENTNWGIFYWRPVDELFNEIADYTVGYLVPIIKYNLARRTRALSRTSTKSLEISSIAMANQKRELRWKRGKVSRPDICIAFTHVEGESHHLRRSINTILHHMETVEPTLTFKTVLVTIARIHTNDTQAEAPYLSDIFDLFDEIEQFTPGTFWVHAMDAATSRCAVAKYTLFMEDRWETRIDSGISLADQTRPVDGS